MKLKTSFYALSLYIITCCSGCSQDGKKPDSTTPAEITNNKTVEPSSDTTGEAPANTPGEVASKSAVWQIEKVRESGEEVKGQRSIVGNFNGTISNGTPTGEKNVIVQVKINKDQSTYIRFFENPSAIIPLPDKQTLNIKVKGEDGKLEFVEQYTADNVLTDTKGILAGKILGQKTPLKINVDLRRGSLGETSIIYFEINPEGLREALQSL